MPKLPNPPRGRVYLKTVCCPKYLQKLPNHQGLFPLRGKSPPENSLLSKKPIKNCQITEATSPLRGEESTLKQFVVQKNCQVHKKFMRKKAFISKKLQSALPCQYFIAYVCQKYHW